MGSVAFRAVGADRLPLINLDGGERPSGSGLAESRKKGRGRSASTGRLTLFLFWGTLKGHGVAWALVSDGRTGVRTPSSSMNGMLIAGPGPVAQAWLDVLGHLHPVLLHFPVALVLVGALAAVWNWLRGEEGIGEFAFHCIWIGALMALLASVSGWFLAEEEAGEEGLEIHRWFAVGATAATVVLAALASLSRTDERPGLLAATRLWALVTAGAMAFAGHLGANMVWGQGAVTRPLMKALRVSWENLGSDKAAPPAEGAAEHGEKVEPSGHVEPASEEPGHPQPEEPNPAVHLGAVSDDDKVPPPVPPKEPVQFTRHLLPLLKERCFECHSGENAKGGIAFDHMDELIKTEGKRAVVLKGDPSRSTLFMAVMKKTGARKMMPPPKSGPRLSPEQCGVIEAWIRQGAKLGD